MWPSQPYHVVCTLVSFQTMGQISKQIEKSVSVSLLGFYQKSQWLASGEGSFIGNGKYKTQGCILGRVWLHLALKDTVLSGMSVD